MRQRQILIASLVLAAILTQLNGKIAAQNTPQKTVTEAPMPARLPSLPDPAPPLRWSDPDPVLPAKPVQTLPIASTNSDPAKMSQPTKGAEKTGPAIITAPMEKGFPGIFPMAADADGVRRGVDLPPLPSQPIQPAKTAGLAISGPGKAGNAVAVMLPPSTPAFLGAQTPSVYIEKIGPANIPVGKPLAYEIVARNAGTVAVSHIHIEDELPAGAHFLTADPKPVIQNERLVWNLGNLEPGADRRIKVQIQPAGEGEIISAATITFSATTRMQTRITYPRLTIKETGPTNIQMGEQAIIQIQVTNTGTGPASGVVLHDKLPPGLWHDQGNLLDAEMGTLAPGESKNVTLVATAVRGGRQVNETSVTSADATPTSTQTAVLITEAALAVHPTGPQRRYLNREAEFAIDISNPGTAPASHVRVTDKLPDGFVFVSATDGGTHDPASGTVVWAVETLPPGQKRHVIVRAVAKKPGDMVNQTQVKADRGLEAKSETRVHVEGIAALGLGVVDVDDPIEVGSETSYDIRVVNQGTCDAARIQILATVPQGMTIRDASGPAAHRFQGQQVIFEPLAKLAPRADAVFRVKVVGDQPGDMRFKVQMTADQLRVPVYEEESTRVYSDQ